jgi:hypothetical protein
MLSISIGNNFEMVWLGLASKLGMHPVATIVAHLSPGTHSLLVS